MMETETKMPVFTQRCIVVGSSTGGTDAVKVFLSGMPSSAPPILIAQHMPESFTHSFVERLNEASQMQVKQAEHQEKIQAGIVYVAPGHSHMQVERVPGSVYQIVLSREPKISMYRPSVEVLFSSAAKALGNKAVGVMLTGMGKDGAVAMLEMHKRGAYNFAQDEASCVVFGMPKSAIELGAVDAIVHLDKMAERVLAYLRVAK